MQGQDVPAVHHEMACERMAKDVGELTRQQFNPRFLDGHAERANRAFEYPTGCIPTSYAMEFPYFVGKRIIDWD